MYKAIKKIGEYKIGDEIPAEQALVWMDMYAEPHVELVDDDTEKLEVIEEKSDSNDNILDDYLARGSSVVKKNIIRDNLSKRQLEKLLKLELKDKNRSAIIKAINIKLLV